MSRDLGAGQCHPVGQLGDPRLVPRLELRAWEMGNRQRMGRGLVIRVRFSSVRNPRRESKRACELGWGAAPPVSRDTP